jgi:hypothetical protein
MTDLDILKHELECAKKATAELPAWKREVIRRARLAEVRLGYIDQSTPQVQPSTEAVKR